MPSLTSSDERNFPVSIERTEKRKLVIERANEESRGSTEPEIVFDQREKSTVTTKTQVSYPEWFDPIQHAEVLTSETKAIDKVPSTILKGTEKRKYCFHPMVVSIGPYHNQDKDKAGNLKFARLEKLKPSIAKMFIDPKPEELVKFEEVARHARAYYEKTATAHISDDAEFTRMMFLDGCFVLHFIDSFINPKADQREMKTDQEAFVLRDLFLLENQLPFMVLEVLMNFKHIEKGWQKCIDDFVGKRLALESRTSTEKDDYKPAHLLDLLRKRLIGDAVEKKPSHSRRTQDDTDWQTFRSVMELKEAGIKCKKADGKTLRNVKFVKHLICANLYLPQFVVDDSTKSMLLNLVAYEASPDGPRDYVVTSYIAFLDALIDHPGDVKELRSKEILKNLLGSDQQVADLFNELANNLVPRRSEYLDIKNNIERHCNKNISKWMTELWSTHFNSPWTTFAFFVGGTIILLTFAQTYFSIFPRGGGSEAERKAPTPSRKIHHFFG